MNSLHKAVAALASCACAGAVVWSWHVPSRPPVVRVRVAQPQVEPARVSPFGPVGATVPEPPAQAAVAPPTAHAAPATEDDACVDPQASAAADGPAMQAAALLVSEQADRLAALAASTADPLAYAFAWQGCLQAGPHDAPSCSLLTAAQWVRLDPDNAIPWLALAGEASARGDEQLEAEAMARAAHASRALGHSAAVPALAGNAIAPPARREQAVATLTAGWRAASMWRAVGPAQVQHYCAPAPAGSEREAVCGELAALLLYRANDLELRFAGLDLARHLAWPADRVEPLAEELDALAEIGAAQTMVPVMDCGNARRVQAWMVSVEAEGEVPRLRRLLLDSGLDVHVWSQRHRRELALAESAAEAAGRHAD